MHNYHHWSSHKEGVRDVSNLRKEKEYLAQQREKLKQISGVGGGQGYRDWNVEQAINTDQVAKENEALRQQLSRFDDNFFHNLSNLKKEYEESSTRRKTLHEDNQQLKDRIAQLERKVSSVKEREGEARDFYEKASKGLISKFALKTDKASDMNSRRKPDRSAVTDFLQKIFFTYDVDRSSYLDKRELRKLIQETGFFGLRPTAQDAEMLLNIMDENHDGKVSFKEFETVMREWVVRELGLERGGADMEDDRRGRSLRGLKEDADRKKRSNQPSRRDLQEFIEELWGKHDRDGSGTLTRDELKDMIAHTNFFGLQPTEKDAVKLAKMFDGDRNGYVTFKEFNAVLGSYLAKQMGISAAGFNMDGMTHTKDELMSIQNTKSSKLRGKKMEEFVESLFIEYDRDGTGVLTHDEIRRLLRETDFFGKKPSTEDTEEMVHLMDENLDGEIQFDEFHKVMMDWLKGGSLLNKGIPSEQRQRIREEVGNRDKVIKREMKKNAAAIQASRRRRELEKEREKEKERQRRLHKLERKSRGKKAETLRRRLEETESELETKAAQYEKVRRHHHSSKKGRSAEHLEKEIEQLEKECALLAKALKEVDLLEDHDLRSSIDSAEDYYHHTKKQLERKGYPLPSMSPVRRGHEESYRSSPLGTSHQPRGDNVVIHKKKMKWDDPDHFRRERAARVIQAGFRRHRTRADYYKRANMKWDHERDLERRLSRRPMTETERLEKLERERKMAKDEAMRRQSSHHTMVSGLQNIRTTSPEAMLQRDGYRRDYSAFESMGGARGGSYSPRSRTVQARGRDAPVEGSYNDRAEKRLSEMRTQDTMDRYFGCNHRMSSGRPLSWEEMQEDRAEMQGKKKANAAARRKQLMSPANPRRAASSERDTSADMDDVRAAYDDGESKRRENEKFYSHAATEIQRFANEHLIDKRDSIVQKGKKVGKDTKAKDMTFSPASPSDISDLEKSISDLNESATKIQAVYKGRKARKDYAKRRAKFVDYGLRESKDSSTTDADTPKKSNPSSREDKPISDAKTVILVHTVDRKSAAVNIQRSWRGYRDRRRVRYLRQQRQLARENLSYEGKGKKEKRKEKEEKKDEKKDEKKKEKEEKKEKEKKDQDQKKDSDDAVISPSPALHSPTSESPYDMMAMSGGYPNPAMQAPPYGMPMYPYPPPMGPEAMMMMPMPMHMPPYPLMAPYPMDPSAFHGFPPHGSFPAQMYPPTRHSHRRSRSSRTSRSSRYRHSHHGHSHSHGRSHSRSRSRCSRHRHQRRKPRSPTTSESDTSSSSDSTSHSDSSSSGSGSASDGDKHGDKLQLGKGPKLVFE